MACSDIRYAVQERFPCRELNGFDRAEQDCPWVDLSVPMFVYRTLMLLGLWMAAKWLKWAWWLTAVLNAGQVVSRIPAPKRNKNSMKEVRDEERMGFGKSQWESNGAPG
jgi:hypothetical protein